MAAAVETIIPQVWTDALTFAVKKNRGFLKVSSLKNHVRKGQMNADEARAILDRMTIDGYLVQLPKEGRGGVHLWEVTDKGREAVQ